MMKFTIVTVWFNIDFNFCCNVFKISASRCKNQWIYINYLHYLFIFIYTNLFCNKTFNRSHNRRRWFICTFIPTNISQDICDCLKYKCTILKISWPFMCSNSSIYKKNWFIISVFWMKRTYRIYSAFPLISVDLSICREKLVFIRL